MTRLNDDVRAPLVRGLFVERPNRFVVVVELEDGREVRAHLPNTGRLTHLTEPGRPYVLRPADDPKRATPYTATRAWDGCWVGLEAGLAPELLIDWLASRPLPGAGRVTGISKEVAIGRHRIDLVAEAGGEDVWIEVKSGGRAEGSAALLSQTPSTRATAQLAMLSQLARNGDAVVVAFVVQRPDVEELVIGGDADPGWIAAVGGAAAAGVRVMAFGCAVSPETVAIDRRLAVRW